MLGRGIEVDHPVLVVQDEDTLVHAREDRLVGDGNIFSNWKRKRPKAPNNPVKVNMKGVRSNPGRGEKAKLESRLPAKGRQARNQGPELAPIQARGSAPGRNQPAHA